MLVTKIQNEQATLTFPALATHHA